MYADELMKVKVSIHSWSSYQEKLIRKGTNIKGFWNVSIHSWSSYQEKRGYQSRCLS